jgi:N-acetylglutamate synthase-like GNAT family acetyltransferase
MSITHKIVSNETEFGSFREAVKNAGLPHQDLNYQSQVLISYYQNDEMIGTGGLEVLDRFALLRSVSVSPDHRSQNIGKQITSDILKNAQNSNLDGIYLLTETAKDYFQKLGFKEVSRDQVPEEIKSTTEFASVCPASAAVMVMKLK